MRPAIDIETNEQAVNRIWLATIPKGIFSFTAGQADTLSGIASLCPLTGGKPVYLARAIYVIINDTTHFDDSTNCVEAEERLAGTYKTLGSQGIYAKVIPNPVLGAATLHYSLSTSGPGRLVIYDMLGYPRMIAELSNKASTFNLNAGVLPQGIYYFIIECAGSNKASGKFAVLK